MYNSEMNFIIIDKNKTSSDLRSLLLQCSLVYCMVWCMVGLCSKVDLESKESHWLWQTKEEERGNGPLALFW